MKTNRRNFIKGVTGFIAGLFCVPKAKGLTNEVLLPKSPISKRSGTKFIAEIPKYQTGDRVRISTIMPECMKYFEKGKDATVICSNITQDGYGVDGGKEAIYVLEIDEVGRTAWYPEYLLTKIGTLVECFDSRQRYEVGTRLATRDGRCFRYVRKPIGTDLLGRKVTMPYWCWIPEDEFIANPSEEFLTMLKVEA